MARDESTRSETPPLQVWLPAFVLKLLVFATFAFVLFEATVGLGEQELGANRVWVIIAGLVGLLLLLGVDRLIGIKVSPGGLEATLTEAKARALEQAGALDDPELAEALEAQILRSENRDQVQAAVELAHELNVNRVVGRIKEAIQQRRKCYVRYRTDPQSPVETYHVAPLDIKPGKTPLTRVNDYLWVHSYEHDRVISLRLGRVLGVELSEETFDPADVMGDWREKEREWNIPRDW
jgi:predicted DNA-binding transcriptional regulator YafY